MEEERPYVRDFYRGQTILLTGYTGYLGKILVEKLLWSCPQVKKIFVLVRPKKGFSPEQRIKKTLESMAFDRVRANYPERLEKVVGLSGDVTEEGLGLSQEDMTRLIQETSIIFHGAASVRFDDPIKLAAEINTRGTKRILDLAKQMLNLKRVITISTAYVNCDRKIIEEKLYPAKMKWRDFLNVVGKTDERTLNILTRKMMGVMPNTYVFTKSIAEHVVDDYRNELPVTICRPSVVVPAKKEPIPGWVDNFFGPLGLVQGTQTGVVRLTNMDPVMELDYVFSDFVINALLVSAVRDPATYNSERMRVLNICSGKEYSISTRELTEAAVSAAGDGNEKLNINVIWVEHSKNSFWYTVKLYYKHLVSAFLIDGLIKLAGHQPLLVNFRRKVHLACQALSHFTYNEFHFMNTECFNLMKDVCIEDSDFKVDFTIDRDKDLYNCVKLSYEVTKKSLMSLMFDDVSKSRIYINSLYYVDATMVGLTYLGVTYMVYYFFIPNALEFINFFFFNSSIF